MKIQEFKEGDVITRIQRAHATNDWRGDGSYMGDPLIFLGIKDGLIYYGTMDSNFVSDFDLEGWEDGWAYYDIDFKNGLRKKLQEFKSKYFVNNKDRLERL